MPATSAADSPATPRPALGFVAPAAALGMVRFGVHSVFLFSVLVTDFAALGRLPVTTMHPPGIMEYFSWRLYDRVITPHGMLLLKALLVISLLMSAAGYLSRITTRTSALLVIFYQGLLRSFGHSNHDEMTGIIFLVILSFTPCADAFSVDSIGKPESEEASFIYGYPILLMQMIIAWVYCSSGLLKLRLSGGAFFSADVLPMVALDGTLDNLHDFHFKLAHLLPGIRALFPAMLIGTVAWEITFPVIFFWRRVRSFYLLFGLLFHFSMIFFLNGTFLTMMAMYLVFVDWPAIAERFGYGRVRRFFTAAEVSFAAPEGAIVAAILESPAVRPWVWLKRHLLQA